MSHLQIDHATALALGMANEPGWTGIFTRREASGMLPNGTQIEKIASESGDPRPDGARGVVLGSIRVNGVGGYFVEWTSQPTCAVWVMERKIKEFAS